MLQINLIPIRVEREVHHKKLRIEMNKIRSLMMAVFAIFAVSTSVNAQIGAVRRYDPTLVVKRPFITPTVLLVAGNTGSNQCFSIRDIGNDTLRMKSWTLGQENSNQPDVWMPTKRYKFRTDFENGTIYIKHEWSSTETAHPLRVYGFGGANVLVIDIPMPNGTSYYATVDGVQGRIGFGAYAVLPITQNYTGAFWVVGYGFDPAPGLFFRPGVLAFPPEVEYTLEPWPYWPNN